MLNWIRNLGRRRYLVRIVFKGGATQELWLYAFTIDKRPGLVTSMNYEAVLPHRLLYTDLGEVAGVYQLAVRGWHK